jgi:hypothetical protein
MSLSSYVDPREREDVRAHEGEEVWVMLNHVKAAQREAFEHFLHTVLMPAISHTHPETYNKVRVLHPTKPNENGTYTYVFLMDPVAVGGTYEISAILHEYYKSDLASEYMKVWDEALASPQEGYEMIQSEW